MPTKKKKKTKPESTLPPLFAIADLVERWKISRFTLMRAAARGDLKLITIAGRVFVPKSEVERAEMFGIGEGRKRWTKKTVPQAEQVATQ